MGCIDDYASFTTELEKGNDKKGEYKIIKESHEEPCGCHPETCCCGGKRWVENKYKKYTDGTVIKIN